MHEFRPASAVRADADLAAAVEAADDAAVRALVVRFGPAVQAHAFELCDGDGRAADELTVRTFAAAPAAAGSYEEERGFAPWLADVLEQTAGRSLDPRDVDRIWTVRLALSDLGDPESPLADHERQRLERRVDHVLDGDDLDDVLAQRWVRARPPAELLAADVPVERVPEPSGATSGRSIRPLALGVGAAFTALVVGIVLLSALSGNPEPVDVTADLVPTGAIDGVEGSVEITELDAGLRIDLSVPSLPPRPTGSYYEVVLGLDDGSTVRAGTFTEGADLALSAGAPLAGVVDLSVIEVAPEDESTAEVGTVVLKLDVAAER